MAGRVTHKGFTIIETMLVLGISGLMLAGVMASVGAGIAAQRYKDAANATVDYFQGQYNFATNVRNDRGSDSYCSSGGISTTPAAAFRATTDCTVLGRVIRGSGVDASSSPLYATVDADTLRGESDPLVALKKSNIVEDAALKETYTLEWGARLYPVGNRGGTQSYTIAIIRSPFTGVVSTFIDTTSSSTAINALIDKSDALSTDAKFCLDASGSMLGVNSERLGVRIAANSVNSSGVTLMGDGGGC